MQLYVNALISKVLKLVGLKTLTSNEVALIRILMQRYRHLSKVSNVFESLYIIDETQYVSMFRLKQFICQNKGLCNIAGWKAIFIYSYHGTLLYLYCGWSYLYAVLATCWSAVFGKNSITWTGRVFHTYTRVGWKRVPIKSYTCDISLAHGCMKSIFGLENIIMYPYILQTLFYFLPEYNTYHLIACSNNVIKTLLHQHDL